MGVPFLMAKKNPSRSPGFPVQQREKSNEPIVDMSELGFAVVVVFFFFSDYFNFADSVFFFTTPPPRGAC